MDNPKRTEQQLAGWAAAAAAGDRDAAQQLLTHVQDDVYRLAVRMLGHPADAEDATQEILLILLTHLSSFRGEARLSTWVWRIAANHLGRVRRGRREADSYEALAERLDAGLSSEHRPDPEAETFVLEVRLRCTEAMLLALDREARIAYILGDICNLSGEEAAAVLELDGPTYRKRLSRSRASLLRFLRERCGIYDEANRCRCAGQVTGAIVTGRLRRDELFFASHPLRGERVRLEQPTRELTELLRVAEVLRSHPDYAAPEAMSARLRDLLATGALTLLRN